MKFPFALLTVLLGFAFIAPELNARDVRGGGGGGGRQKASSPSHNRSSSAKRSPMTGSKMKQPASRPKPKPVARPQAKPASRPQAKPAARPQPKPAARPQPKPATRPQTKPAARPDARPSQRPSVERPSVQRPTTRPETRPSTRPDKRPSIERPGTNRPSTLPGMVTYPNKPGGGKPGRPTTLPAPGTRPGGGRPEIGDRPGGGNRPGVGDRPGIGDRPGGGNLPGLGNRPGNRPGQGNRPNIGDRNNVNIGQINVGGRNVGLNRPATLPARDRDWNSNRWGGNRGVWGNNNNINVNIDNNFRRNVNYSYRPNYWGGRPWWGAGTCHNWHHGHWNYGWNSRYYHNRWYFHDDDNFASGFMWGIAVWSLGNMIYDMGYKTYTNPYPAPPVQNTYITYSEPVSVAAAANPPGDEEATTLAETKSAEAVERSRAAFKDGDYVTAMTAVDEALGYTPGDVTLHEYRALVFFALGKYSDAAGVLNPVLASGPGWGWDTMVDFYNSSETYDGQLRKLEAYVKGRPDAADGHFLLGYHYMVCGHTEKSYEQFDKASELQPADSISRQLRDLTKSSLPDGDAAEPPARPDPVPAEKLIGTWVSDRGDAGKVTFTMTDDGNYTWNFMNGGQSSELKGTYGLDDKGLLVLSSDDAQMISEIALKDDKDMHFTLVGAPDGDPGLDFVKN